MTLNAETRAALEHAIDALDPKGQGGWCTREEIIALQALLDEKGGDGPEPNLRSMRNSTPCHALPERVSVAGAASTAPPDSAARIAADLRGATFHTRPDGLILVRIMGDTIEVGHWSVETAARVEALGLELGERETVRRAIENLLVIASPDAYSETPSPFQSYARDMCARAIAALAPIAERGEHESGCRCPECDPAFNDPRQIEQEEREQWDANNRTEP